MVFYLMTYKGYYCLKSIIENGFTNYITCIIIGRDKAVINDYSSEIVSLCKKFNLRFQYREHYKFDIKSKYSFAISWRWLIKSEENLIVFHDSLLPKYRGFAPLVNMLINGEPKIGVTALFASENYDCGDIIAQESKDISYPITINEAIISIAHLYGKLLNRILDIISNKNNIIAVPQIHEDASYSLWRDSKDYSINWNRDADTILRFINAVGYPYQGAQSKMGEKEIIIHKAVKVPDLIVMNRDVGKVLFFDKGYPVIVCGKGLIKIKEAVYKDSHKSIFPLNKFRLRFYE